MAPNDTIAAIATPPGAGGIGIVRVSGPRASAIAEHLLQARAASHVFHFSTFSDAAGELLDKGLAVFFAGPRSFTGEDVLELHAHGSPVILDLLLRRVCELGARRARPGEFSERAFLNGKLDLVQAEAVADLIAAGSETAVRAALRSLDGEFSARIREITEALVHVRAWLEAALDFPEEEIDFLSLPQLAQQLHSLCERCEHVLESARRGVILRDGLHVVILGRPNAGKSSLLNALAQSDRAIVTAVPGTTRDVLRESVVVDGIALTLVDTAGLRESADIVEQEGMRRAREELARADVALLVTDTAHAETDAALLHHAGAGAARIILHNRIDLSGEAARVEHVGTDTHVYLSAQRGDGIALLRAELARRAGGEAGAGAFSARTRHVQALERCARHLDAAALRLADRAGELAAEDLRLAHQVLGEITGEFRSDDLLGVIFSTFCIGK